MAGNIRVIDLGVQSVKFGKLGDPDRIKTMIGGFNHMLGREIEPDRFADHGEQIRNGRGIADWPVDEDESPKSVELISVCFGKGLPNYEAMLHEAASLPGDLGNLKKAGFPHLATHFSARKAKSLWRQKIQHLHVTDEASLWRSSGELYLLLINCSPAYRIIGGNRVTSSVSSEADFLFYRELEEQAA